MKFVVLTAEGDLATFSQNHKTKHFKSCNVELAANQVSVLSFSPDHVRVVGGGGEVYDICRGQRVSIIECLFLFLLTASS